MPGSQEEESTWGPPWVMLGRAVGGAGPERKALHSCLLVTGLCIGAVGVPRDRAEELACPCRDLASPLLWDPISAFSPSSLPVFPDLKFL